jgi:hypothetical protein
MKPPVSGTCSKELDPLAELYQMEDIECTPLERDALLLLTRLLENVEEFYVLNEQIRDIIAEDDAMGEKIIELFNAMIHALKIEQSYAGNLDRSL